ncbi:hypothetical protein [Streptomyces sp. H39-S7]|uniref:hypothetical protein n=1 Tax=Streptomyces sp. H39-S7 TaxID=3004357 RepID=UPI0022AF6919|nr:hypothetical protein [Streptomyces sp. H39-S7]MCZ4118878.1 hypothetical protein [Streptomyces sp. H39-S7]
MRDIRRPAAAGAAVLFMLSGAVPAFADQSSATASGTVTVTPGKTWAGAVITLQVKSACRSANRAKASAEVFVSSVTLAPPVDGQDGLVSDASIRSDAVAGTYAVSVECDGKTHAAEGSVVVINSVSPVSPVEPVKPVKPVKPEPLWPTAPVPAGGGGTAQLAAGPAEAGPGTDSVLAIGGAAAAAFAAVAVYRRRRDG